MASRDINTDFEIVVDRAIKKHECFDKGWRGAGSGTPVGRVACCKECGRHWYVKDSHNYERLVWFPVRWYHWKMRRAIVGK